MNLPATCRLRLSFLCSLILLATFASAQPPVVRKVEPPNWWLNYTSDLTLLLTGENLKGARVESATHGATVAGSEPSPNGHYLFVRLLLNAKLRTGNVQLHLRTAGGSATVQLPLLARADPHGHFAGFSQEDVIYLIMPDRFADGDPSNDQPPGSTGVYDRSQPKAYHGGDLRGIREHLDYLHDLGVNTLWLTPVWKNTDSDYHGYHVVDFYALDDHMGSMQEYRGAGRRRSPARHEGADRLRRQSHRPSASLGERSADADLVSRHARAPSRTRLTISPGWSILMLRRVEYRATLDGWFAGKLPDLNPDDPELAVYLAQNAMWWTEIAQLDGFRLDTFPYSTRQFWSGWHDRLHRGLSADQRRRRSGGRRFGHHCIL